MQVRLAPADAARLDKLISLLEGFAEAIKAIDASTTATQANTVSISEELVSIETTLKQIAENTQPEPPVVGIEITPGTPTNKP